MVIGGQAVLLYGEPRLTKDIDITLGLTIDQWPTVEKIIKKLNLKILVSNPPAFLAKTWVLPCLDQRSGLRVDFIFSYSPYEQKALQRTTPRSFDRTTVFFASVEDILIHKVVAGRPRDLEDASAILQKNKKINFKYVDRWLQEFEKISEKPLLKTWRTLQKNIKPANGKA